MSTAFQLWPEHPFLALTGVIVATVLILYVLRHYAHAAILRVACLLHRQLRLAARALRATEQHLAVRNQEVLRSLQDELLQRQIDRETLRIRHLVERDTVAFRHLEREINGQLAAISEDYEACTQVPPIEPKWVAAVDAIAKLHDRDNDEVLNRILRDIHDTVQQQQREAMREYRWTINTRHRLLAGLRPYWRKLAAQVGVLSSKSDRLLGRLGHIESLAARYEVLQNRSEAIKTSSIITRFLIAALFCTVGAAVAMVGYQLMVAPLAEILAGRELFAMEMAPIVAAVHIGMVIAVSVILLESLQMTRMFPLVGGLHPPLRRALIVISTLLLLTLAAVQAGLASWQLPSPAPLMVEPPLAEAEAAGSVGVLAEMITANEVANIERLSYRVLGVLGFFVPLMLLLVIIPLEYLFYTAHPVIGVAARAGLHFGIAILRLTGRLLLELGRLTVRAYDAVIFLPLYIERLVVAKRAVADPVIDLAPQPIATPVVDPTPVHSGVGTTVTKVDFDSWRTRN